MSQSIDSKRVKGQNIDSKRVIGRILILNGSRVRKAVDSKRVRGQSIDSKGEPAGKGWLFGVGPEIGRLLRCICSFRIAHRT